MRRLLRCPRKRDLPIVFIPQRNGKKGYFEINTNCETLNTYLTSGAHNLQFYFLLQCMHRNRHDVIDL